MEKIETSNAPKVIGPYSQAIVSGNFIFVSGQIPIVAQTGKLLEGNIKEQARLVFQNILSILQERNCNFSNIVRVDLFLSDLKDFNEVNDVFSEIFVSEPKPARQTIQAAALPLGAKIEISCIAEK